MPDNVEYTKKDLIVFEDGIFGFEDYKEFLPLPVEDDSGNIISMVSVDDENISFLLINPFALDINYNPILSKEDYNKLNTQKDEDLSFYVICVVSNDVEKATVNLKCPVVVNALTRDAIQTVLQTEEYTFKHSLKSLTKEG